ncbi:hypothetical protein J5N97_008309 [Dioscorea zingiberensis]|uniref:RING-type E3 ubiquitin transferase n=1 Tax=Dioscorea zingiberensis TaxID=325984 RepID=A0A9D5DDJ5_9LILI|nr:hypothetical protein J5N97_008309 [Dioscorea zingiberensis]
MASGLNQEQWMPFEPTKDCSQGFCSIYCPQWCYIIFPPPPPFFSDDESSSGPSFSPLVIIIIGVLASAFLLVSYYTIISKYCVSFNTLRRRFRTHSGNPQGELEDDVPGASSRRYETWHNSPSNGLDEALINKITVCRYKQGDGLIDCTDCSVCLSEFREDDSLRLLPKCSHAFHLHCIDTWLKSHSNCPLCRANIISVTPAPPPLPLPAPPEPSETTTSPPNSGESQPSVEIVVVAIEESNRREEEENDQLENYDAKDKDTTTHEEEEEDQRIVEIKEDGIQGIRRSFSMDSSTHRGRVSIADVLRLSIEEEYNESILVARENELTDDAGSSRRHSGEQFKGRSSSASRGLHCAMSPVPMKRSFSSTERFFFTRHARGRSSVLPL